MKKMMDIGDETVEFDLGIFQVSQISRPTENLQYALHMPLRSVKNSNRMMP